VVKTVKPTLRHGRPGRIRNQERTLREKTDGVLDFIEITHVADELAGNLSGGQKKLLELGRTMMVDPRLVFLDEVGAGVNRTLLKTIITAIRRLNVEKGHTFCLLAQGSVEDILRKSVISPNLAWQFS
jgi:branched-chain amino acid transport system ATP-binding protein